MLLFVVGCGVADAGVAVVDIYVCIVVVGAVCVCGVIGVGITVRDGVVVVVDVSG